STKLRRHLCDPLCTPAVNQVEARAFLTRRTRLPIVAAMKPNPGPASSPATWGLTLVFVALISAAITHTSILWRRMSGEDTRDVRWAQVAQTFQAARVLYGPHTTDAKRVVLLGDSRVWFAAQSPYVEREIRRIAPDLDVEVDNLAIFGAQIA